MPAPSDDELFKRMFASFVQRKNRTSATHVPPQHTPPGPSSSNRLPYLDTPPDVVRKVATEFNGRAISGSATSPNLHALRQGYNQYNQQTSYISPNSSHQSSHKNSRHHHTSNDRQTGFHSLFNFRGNHNNNNNNNSHGNGNQASPSSRKHFPKGSRGSRGSKSSKGSKGSEKQVSASTEDAPPRKRQRAHNALQRSQSAHAGSLHTSSSRKTDKVRNNARFNLPPTHSAAASSSTANNRRGSAANKANRSFPCSKCDAVFAQNGQLSRHTKRVHEKLRPHACEYCGRLFGARSDRTRHVLIVHQKMRQFPCDRCGFQFQAKTHLESHIRTVHDGERPYKCAQCGFSFGLRSNLLTHERAVHYREAKWNCTVCDTAFNRKHDMFRHMKLMHDTDPNANSSSGTTNNGKKS